MLKRLSGLLSLIYIALYSPGSHASPWIGTIEPQLHADLQTLAEWGYIDVAITSFPVPWKGIVAQLEALRDKDLAPSAMIALQRLRHYIHQLHAGRERSFVSLYGATQGSRFSTFDSALASKAKLSIDTELYKGRWAANIAINYLPGGEKNLDRSFIAYQFGDWNLRLGSLDQWWGPATSSSLIVSNNARPIPAIALSRAESGRSSDSWLSVLGPWYFTTQLGQLESKRHVPDAKLLMSRFNFKPLSDLEVGVSWLTLWGGKGQGNGLGDLWDAAFVLTDCSVNSSSCQEDDATKGNHIASLDFKYTAMLAKRPVSIYSQLLTESSSSEQATLFGLASYVEGYRVYLESSNTEVACSKSDDVMANCVYEDRLYQSGMRYHGRAIGSTFDSDAKTLILGVAKHYSDGDMMELALRKIELNSDRQQPSPVVMGNNEKIAQVSGFYQSNWGNWQVKLGGLVERSQSDTGDRATNKLLYTQIKYAFN